MSYPLETEDRLAQLSRNPDAISRLRRMLSHPLSSTADHVDTLAGALRRIALSRATGSHKLEGCWAELRSP